MYVPGSDLTVDEAMVRFTCRSLETTTIPQKPTPTGYKYGFWDSLDTSSVDCGTFTAEGLADLFHSSARARVTKKWLKSISRLLNGSSPRC
jgi:hypothetical protein